MSILLIVGPKYTLAASHAAPGELRRVCRRDRETPDRYITLCAINAASVIFIQNPELQVDVVIRYDKIR